MSLPSFHSLYNLIPLPNDLVYHILELSNCQEYACLQCQKWDSAVQCTSCGVTLCKACSHECNELACCHYCDTCSQWLVCDSPSPWGNNDPMCWDYRNRHDTKCSMELATCKLCCIEQCDVCENWYCCSHIKPFDLQYYDYMLCLECWKNIRQKMDELFYKSL